MASGNTLLVFLPQGSEPPSSNYATLDTRNGHFVLDYDPTTNETAFWRGVLPQHYSGGGITVYLHWAATAATSGDVIWGVEFERIGEGQQDLDSDGFATGQTVTATAPGTSGHVDIASVAFTNGAQIDSIAVGEAFRLKVYRDAASASDTMTTSDAELLAVELRET